MNQQPDKQPATVMDGATETSRKLWVIAVIAFWVSLAVTLVVREMKGGFDLILVSITVGLMVLGVWLKIRYTLQQRKSNKS